MALMLEEWRFLTRRDSTAVFSADDIGCGVDEGEEPVQGLGAGMRSLTAAPGTILGRDVVSSSGFSTPCLSLLVRFRRFTPQPRDHVGLALLPVLLSHSIFLFGTT